MSIEPKKKNSKLAYALIGAAGLGTLLIGVPAFQDRGPVQNVAEVNGQDIQLMQLEQVFRDLRNRSATAIDESQLRQIALDNLIDQTVLNQHALSSGYQFSDQALYQYIKAEFGDEAAYQRMLDENKINAKSYQESVRQSQSVENYYRILELAALPKENQALSRQLSLARDVYAVRIPLEPFAQHIRADEAALAQYYEQHQQAYLSQPQVNISYILLSPEQLVHSVHVSAEQLAMVRAQREANIVRGGKYLIFDNASDAEQAAADIAAGSRHFADIFAEVNAGKIAGQAGELNPNAKGKGISKEVDEALFAIAKIGEVSPVFQTEYGAMLVQLGSIEGAEAIDDERLRKEIALEQSNERFSELANALFDAAQNNTPLIDLANQAGVRVQSLELVEPSSRQEAWLGNPQVQEALFGRKALAVNSSAYPVDLGNQGLFLVVNARTEAAPQAFETVREQVLKDYQNTQAKASQRAAAQALEQALNAENGDVNSAIAHAYGEVHQFKQLSYLMPPSAEIAPFVQMALLKQQARVASHEFADNSIMVARIDAMTPIEEAKIDKKLLESMQQASQAIEIRGVQMGLREWLRASSKIRVDNAVLEAQNTH